MSIGTYGKNGCRSAGGVGIHRKGSKRQQSCRWMGGRRRIRLEEWSRRRRRSNKRNCNRSWVCLIVSRRNYPSWYFWFRNKNSMTNSLAIFVKAKTPVETPAASPSFFLRQNKKMLRLWTIISKGMKTNFPLIVNYFDLTMENIWCIYNSIK